jgi:hypothetical protein
MIGILAGCLVMGPGVLNTSFQGHNDFRAFYIGGRLVGGDALYDVARVVAAQRQTFGEVNPHTMMVRPPFYYTFVAPLARLPFRTAWLLWTVGQVLAMVLFVRLYPWGDRTALAMVCCWSLPLLWSFAAGQDFAFLLLILAGGLWAFERQKYLLAGLVLSLCAIKFHLFLLVPLLTFGEQRLRKGVWRTAAGLMLGLTALLTGSFLVAGRDWPQKYVSMILNPEVSLGVKIMPNLHGLAANFPGLPFLEVFLSLLVIGMVWWVVRRRSFETGVAAVLVGGLLLSRHSYLWDCAILIPALFAFIRNPSGFAVRWCALALVPPVLYIFLIVRSATIPVTLFFLLLVAVTLDRRPDLHRLSTETIG